MKKLILFFVFLNAIFANGQSIHYDTLLTKLSKTDTLKIRISENVNFTDTATFTGTSVTAGSGASTVPKTYVAQVAAGLQLAPLNNGLGGYTLSYPPGTSAPGFVNTDYLTKIPVKNSKQKYLFFEWGENDSYYSALYYPGVLDYSPSRFNTAYHTVIDYAISRGWAVADMRIISPAWQLITRTPKAVQDTFYNRAKAVAVAYGISFIDTYISTQLTAPATISDDVHPSDYGHAKWAEIILQAMNSVNTVKGNSQTIADNGLAEFKRINMRNLDTARDGAHLMIVNPDGTLATVPIDRFLQLFGPYPAVPQTGNIYNKGDMYLQGQYRSSGGINITGLPYLADAGLALGMYSGFGYVEAVNGSGGHVGLQISPFGQKTSYGGLLNTGDVALHQFTGGMHIKSGFFALDSGTTATGQAYRIETNGTNIWWNDKAGTAHKLNDQTSTPTLDQVMAAGSTLTANRTIIDAGFNFNITGTGTRTFTSTAANQFRLAYDGSNYTDLWATAAGNFVITPNGAAGYVGINGNLFGTQGFGLGYVAKTANYSVTSNDYFIDCTSGSFTVTLMSAVGVPGRMYTINNSGAGTITIATSLSQTIQGSAPGTLAANAVLRVISDGANWKKDQ